MSSFKSMPKKTFIVIVIIFLLIAVLHIWNNYEIVTRDSSPGWSNALTLKTEKLSKKPIVEVAEDKTVISVFAVGDENGKIGMMKLNTNMSIKDDYVLELEPINFNQIIKDEIYLINKHLLWRNYKDFSIYIASFDKEYKSIISYEKIFENVENFDAKKDGNNTYMALAKKDGSVDLVKIEEGNMIVLESPNDLSDVKRVKIVIDQDKVFLQSACRKNGELRYNIFVSEYSGGNWNNSIKVDSLVEVRKQYRDMTLGIDKNFVYSFVVTIWDNASQNTYSITGYNKEDKKLFKHKIVEDVRHMGIGSFSSIPILINSSNDLEVITSAPTRLDDFNSKSNIIKLTFNPEGFKNAAMISNTKDSSSKVSLAEGDGNQYVFWVEPKGFRGNIYKVVSNNQSAIDYADKFNFANVVEAISYEFPVPVYLFFLSFVTRIFQFMPAFLWLLVLLIFGSKYKEKKDILLIIGMVIFLISQVFFMDLYYSDLTMNYMLKIINFTGAKYVIPIIITLLGYILTIIYRKEKPLASTSNIYFTFLATSYFDLNYIFAPYVFIYTLMS